MLLDSLDWSGMANVCISVTIGSVVATLLVWKLVSYFVNKAFLGVLEDTKVQSATEHFIINHIVVPFNSLNNSELKELITQTAEKSLELALKKLKEKEEKN